MNYFKPIILACAVIQLAFGLSCANNDRANKDLSRSKAEQLIRSKTAYPQDLQFAVCSTRVAVSNAKQYATQMILHQNYFSMLEELGLVTFSTNLTIDPGFTVFIAEFTEKGKEFVVGPTTVRNTGHGNKYYQVRTGSIDFGEITGIVQQDAFSIAEVNYTERAILTPFGQFAEIPESYSKVAVFTKYDDGWRMN